VPTTFPQTQFWKDLLNQWVELLQRYELGADDDDDPDVAYWYGERPLTGLLGAAGWLLQDGWSLEEFSTKRKLKVGNGMGRGDLWVGRGEAKATVEAKIYWAGETIPTAQRYLSDKLDEAATQLQAVSKKNRVGDPVALCYVVPWYDIPAGRDRGIEVIAALETWARGQAWATAKHISASTARTVSKGSDYPGVLLVGRTRRGRRVPPPVREDQKIPETEHLGSRWQRQMRSANWRRTSRSAASYRCS
jgi:hypothetical protein